MSIPRRAGFKRPAALLLAGVTLTALTLTASTGAQAATTGPTSIYIVQIAGDPVATYAGTESGYAATKPAAGTKLDSHSAAANAYGAHLKAKQKSTLAKVGVDSSKITYQYNTAINGVAVKLTASQATKLKSTVGVVNVWKNTTVTIQTPPTDKFLGLTGPLGVWNLAFGGDKRAGAGVIIGDIDTGFWPESPSFAPINPTAADNALIASKWHGTCDAGDDHPVTCNNKVIGARWFDAAGNSNANPGEFHSPRDFDGHGSHTASTAAGDHVSNVTVNGVAAGDVEGVAPGARLAVYKVLYESADGTTASGSSADITDAIEQAILDGVDVINYSIGDNVDNFSSVELAFLNAAAAGVFVSAAAGNAGPGASTVDNAMPWETTVAAGTYDVGHTKSVTLGNGATYTGVGVGAAVASSPLINSASAGLATASVSDATLCVSGTLDPAKVTGKIVLCQRGGNARTDKSKAVQLAGGVGMILGNPSPNSLNADFHFVPTVHVDDVANAAIKAYIAGTASPTASISASTQITTEAPQVATFSSRGPSLSSGGGLLKPDIMAPGNDVIAAVSPANHSGNLYDTESGTSMATPHIAGVAALVISKHPNWSPMEVKSAILTSANTLDNQKKPITNDNGTPAGPLDYGSGEVDPLGALIPGLVYDSDITQWLQYSCGIGVHLSTSTGDVCDSVGSVTPSEFNSPNIASGNLTGSLTVHRTVTNVDPIIGIYDAKVKAPAGFTVKVSPSHLILKPGASATFTVTITRTTAPLNQYAFGSLTWTGLLGLHKVTSVIAVKPVALAAPGEVDATGVSGSQALSLKTGYSGTLTAAASGLAAADEHDFSLVEDVAGFDPTAPATGPGTGEYVVTVPAGTKVARFATFASDYPAGTDVDEYVFADTGSGFVQVGQSAGGTADESVTFTDPDPGTYVVFVDAFDLPTQPMTVKGYSFLVTGPGSLTATPASQAVTLGGTATVTAGWSGLTAGKHYLGIVEYGDGTNVIGSTLVAVDA